MRQPSQLILPTQRREKVENKTEEAKEEVIELKASTFKIETKGMSKAALAKLAD
jgi:hypothetical protein